MLEAMASGTPVAAYPVDGPLQVLGGSGQVLGGVLSENLMQAVEGALQVGRHQARARAEKFAWPETVALFKSYLVPVKPS